MKENNDETSLISFQIPKKIKKLLEKKAKEDDRSLSAYLRIIIVNALKNEK